MNFGMLVLALLLTCSVVIGIGIIAGSPHDPYSDSFGNVTSEQTNATQGVLTNSTAPLSDAAGGVVLVIGFFIVIVAVWFLVKATGGGMYGQGRR